MHEQNNLLSIASGSFLGIWSYITNSIDSEILHVLMVGIVGGAGGYIGKYLIHRVVLYCKNNK